MACLHLQLSQIYKKAGNILLPSLLLWILFSLSVSWLPATIFLKSWFSRSYVIKHGAIHEMQSRAKLAQGKWETALAKISLFHYPDRLLVLDAYYWYGIKSHIRNFLIFQVANESVLSGEDSDTNENKSYSESSEEDNDRSKAESDGEEKREEGKDNWAVGTCDLQRLDFTADWRLNVQLPDNPLFSDYFHLLFTDNLFDGIATQATKYTRETIVSLQQRYCLLQHSQRMA